MTNTKQRLTDVEQHTMLATWRLGVDAFGAAIRDELAEATGRRLTVSAIYSTLVRLEDRGLVRSELTEPEPVRGGKSKRRFAVTPLGVTALRLARQELDRLWDGLDGSTGYKTT